MKRIPYGHQWIDVDDIKAVKEVLRSDWITQGPKIKEFEDALCKYTGAKYAVVVSSGTAALHIACLAAGIKAGDEVITSPITFVASANCILYCGGKPVFADVQPDTANIDPDKIEKFIEAKCKSDFKIGKLANWKTGKLIKGIIPVHFAGQPCDMLQIYRIAKKYNLIVIEDASHALGAEYQIESKIPASSAGRKNQKSKWIKVGSCKHSDMTVFSFHPVKPITTGEGGAVLTNNKEYYEKLLILRTHGISKEKSNIKNQKSKLVDPWYYEMQFLGYNYRLTDFQCALGISQLKKLDKFIKRRREIVEIYEDIFKNNEFFNLPVEKNYARSSWHLYPIRLKDKYKNKRKEIFRKLREKGLWVQVHYIPVYWQPYYQQLGYKKGLCPNAGDFYQREISIPLYQSMSTENIKYVINTILEIFKEI